MPESPHRLVATALWTRGFPTAVESPAGIAPAVVVWTDDPDEPALPLLRRALGGALLLDLHDHHGEPTLAFWIGVGRPAALAAGVVEHRAALGVADERTLLGASAAEAWALHARLLAMLSPSRERGAASPDEERLLELVDAMERTVAAALPIAPHITSGLMLALAAHWRRAEAAVELTLPTTEAAMRWTEGMLTSRT